MLRWTKNENNYWIAKLFCMSFDLQTANAILFVLLHGKQHTVTYRKSTAFYTDSERIIRLTVFNMIISAKFRQIYFVT